MMQESLPRIGVFGASGRMGGTVAGLLRTDYAGQARPAACVDRNTGEIDDFRHTDAVIDFSLPPGTAALLDWFSGQQGKLPAYVCGTTGLDADHLRRLEDLGRSTAVMQANNFSTGVAAMAAILQTAGPLLAALGYAPAMTETHHVHKRDAPSGTALTLAAVVSPDNPAAVPVTSIREGEVVGRHEIEFIGTADRITVAHEALDRSLFARGAIDAALWFCGQPERHGFFTMQSYFRERFARTGRQMSSSDSIA